ncbi:cysteine-rich secretory protein 1-like [Cricetulus griseus]|uniref:Cysteine-rich secretory protein 1-like n=1 Tax=Cricetulus griseus TaxID=10029 RepID=A0A9J7KCP2_CRIGR|nr:cysteine-rich secretory protein 1-like [Cricetulus griseus]XP_035313769.1 cysteine-rich secretory protein 1-like [Cricetulus griseus]
MTLLPLLLLLAAALPPSLLHNSLQIESLDDLSTARDSIREEIVNKHNELRKMVSPPASDLLMMQWSNDAQENAQKWASQCTFQHSPREDRKIKNLACGENLFMSDYLTSWSSAVQQWYDEVHSFDFGSGPTSSSAVVGHYTQLVWNTSYLVACGIAECRDQSWRYLYVCQYCPPGNYVRRKYIPYTIGDPCGSCPNDCEDGLCTNSCGYQDDYSNCGDLKASVTCKHPMVKEHCKATCNCEGKIH